MGRRGWWVLGIVLVVAGLGAAVRIRMTSQNVYGWLAYTPLDGEDASSEFQTEGLHLFGLMGTGQQLALLTTVLGLVVLGGCVGYRLGRRRR